MAIAKEDLDQIKHHFAEWANEWASDTQFSTVPGRFGTDMLERMVRVEESLTHQMELIKQIIQETQQRFELVDKRFELMEKRFEQIDRRFLQIDRHFEQMDRRFEQMDRHFEQMDRSVEQIDRRFEELTQRMDRFIVWSFGTTLATGGIVISVIKLWV